MQLCPCVRCAVRCAAAFLLQQGTDTAFLGILSSGPGTVAAAAAAAGTAPVLSCCGILCVIVLCAEAM